MPGYRDPIRFMSRNQRADKLVQTAENMVVNGVSRRSWTQMGSDWLNKCSAPFSSLFSFLGTSAADMGKGYMVGKAAEQVSTLLLGPIGGKLLGIVGGRTAAGIKALFNAIPESVLEMVQDAFSDWADDQKKEGVEGLGGLLAGIASRRIYGTVQGCATPKEALPPVFERALEKAAELAVRVVQYKTYLEDLKNGSEKLNYCDDAVALCTAFYQIDALRAQVSEDIALLESWLKTQKAFLEELRLDQIKAATILPLIRGFLDDPGIPHYTAYSWNVLRRSHQCSEAHCFGKGA